MGSLIRYVTVDCGVTVRVCFSYCTGGEPCTPSYWKNQPDAWSIDSVTIGGVLCTKAQATAILQGANAKDAIYKLVAHLPVAKLNVTNDVSVPTSVLDAIEDADNFLFTHPLGTNPHGAYCNYALNLKDIFAFNNS